MTAETTVIDALATFRLTRLIVEDTWPPIRKLRTWIHERWPPIGAAVHVDDGWRLVPPDQPQRAHRWMKFAGIDFHSEVKVQAGAVVGDTPVEHAVVMEAHPLGELCSCEWCMSIWCGAAVYLLRRFAPRVWDPVAKCLAFSAASGMIASHT